MEQFKTGSSAAGILIGGVASRGRGTRGNVRLRRTRKISSIPGATRV